MQAKVNDTMSKLKMSLGNSSKSVNIMTSKQINKAIQLRSERNFTHQLHNIMTLEVRRNNKMRGTMELFCA